VTTRGTIGQSVGGTVLVIDDDEIALLAITEILRHGGYSVHPLASPIGATQLIATLGIVAAVIDLNMPVMRGDRFIALVRSWDRIRDLPIVLISGDSPQNIRDAAARLPGVAVVTKAQMAGRLVPTMDNALTAKHSAAAKPSLGATSHAGPPAHPGRAKSELGKSPQARHAHACLAAWRDYSLTRTDASALLASIVTLRDELRLQGLLHAAQLISAALEVAQLCSQRAQVPDEANSAIAEVLGHLANAEGDRARSTERSLALDIQRSRLERARQLLL